jgi:hypothetical protein
MNELLPFMAGCLLGLLAPRRASTARQVLFILALGIPLGVAASAINGELAVSWGFVLVDTALVVGPAFVSLVTARRLRARGQRDEAGLL